MCVLFLFRRQEAIKLGTEHYSFEAGLGQKFPKNIIHSKNSWIKKCNREPWEYIEQVLFTIQVVFKFLRKLLPSKRPEHCPSPTPLSYLPLSEKTVVRHVGLFQRLLILYLISWKAWFADGSVREVRRQELARRIVLYSWKTPSLSVPPLSVFHSLKSIKMSTSEVTDLRTTQEKLIQHCSLLRLLTTYTDSASWSSSSTTLEWIYAYLTIATYIGLNPWAKLWSDSFCSTATRFTHCLKAKELTFLTETRLWLGCYKIVSVGTVKQVSW